MIGIIVNVALAAFKALVGLVSGSIAIVLDAVNNLSDALSSLITIIGTKLAGKPADKKHPYGHGRIEYISAMIIAVIVLYAGVTSLKESVTKIVHPEVPDYTTVTLIIVASAVAVKILLGGYVKKIGKEVNSDSLINSGEDAKLDAVISASTLAAAFVYIFFHISLEAWLGAVISLVIIKSGIGMLQDTVSSVLGQRVSGSLTKAIKKTICEEPEVSGAYDLILHDYGPDRFLGSVHCEVPDYMTADQLDVLTRHIEDKVFQKHHVILTAVGFYAVNTRHDKAADIRDDVRRIVMNHENVLQMHGFYVELDEKQMRFDVVIDLEEKDRRGLFERILSEVRAAYPDYNVEANMDANISD